MEDKRLRVFLRKRQIPLLGSVDLKMQSQFTESILLLNALDEQKPITLFIDSRGGSVGPALAIADAIVSSKAPVHGLVVAEAYSAAFMVLQNCHTRLSYPNAQLMFHAPLIRAHRIDEDLSKDIEQAKLYYKKTLKLTHKRSGQNTRTLRAWGKKERYFSGEEAHGLGFVDNIVRGS